MSSYLVVQLYCTPIQADSVRTAATAELANYSEFGQAHVGLKQEAETDYEMHLDWAGEHPGRDAGDRAYFLLEMTSPVDIPESVLRKAETEIIEWIGSTYNDGDIVEVPWASHAGTNSRLDPKRSRRGGRCSQTRRDQRLVAGLDQQRKEATGWSRCVAGPGQQAAQVVNPYRSAFSRIDLTSSLPPRSIP